VQLYFLLLAINIFGYKNEHNDINRLTLIKRAACIATALLTTLVLCTLFVLGCIAGQSAIVQLDGLSFSAKMMRSRGGYTGMTTLSRSFLLQCSAGTRVRAVLAFGQLNSGPADYNLVTFLALPYRPKSVTAASWALYRYVCLTPDVYFEELN